MREIIYREAIYFLYYFTVQSEQILPYWAAGILIGSAVSVFLKDKIHACLRRMNGRFSGVPGIFFASAVGVASPLCMYGTIPIAASFAKSGVREEWLAAFMMSSVLLNPQLVAYSASLGAKALAVRVVSCYLCGAAAGLFIFLFYGGEKKYFRFDGFEEPRNNDTDPNVVKRYIKNVGRNVKATTPWFLAGVALAALFQRYVPASVLSQAFGGNRTLGILFAATAGVPLYACGGGTIPLIQQWLAGGAGLGGAAAFMLTGPATKITNLGALKIVLGAKSFCFYIAFVMAFALLTGMLVNMLP